MTQEHDAFNMLRRRYAGASPEAFLGVMCPLMIPIRNINRHIHKVPGQSHWRATFWVTLDSNNQTVIQVGRTGKFVPGEYFRGGPWREIAKGRIISVDYNLGIAEGEIYVGDSSSFSLNQALAGLTENDYLEIDQYGASAKILSALSEFYLVQHGRQRGYNVIRMPEDMARHLGAYPNFDFLFIKNSQTIRVEAKSLWGTNTNYARLIHSTTTRPRGEESEWTENQRVNYYPTSSCKFLTQDVFAVNLFLRTGNIEDFAFARSIPGDMSIHGLPRSKQYPEHVNQNPVCQIDNTVWFDDIDRVCSLL